VAIHFQNDVVGDGGRVRAGLGEGDRERELFVGRARRLIEGVRARGVAVVFVRIAFPTEETAILANAPIFRDAVRSAAVREGSYGAEFHPLLGPIDGEPVVTHARVNAFFESDLDAVLRRLDVERVLLAGVATHSTVEHTARHATDVGYHVTVIVDACASGDAGLHDASLRVLRAHVERVSTIDEVLHELSARPK